MALNAYLKLKGQKTGDINGSVTMKGRENTIEVIACSHEIVSPRDAASGLPTGKRMHKPFVITQQVDCSSPLLYNVLCTNENITAWLCNFYQPDATGVEKNYFRVELTNASIASMSMRMFNNRIAENMKLAMVNETAFCYQAITWTSLVPSTITAGDDWLKPDQA